MAARHERVARVQPAPPIAACDGRLRLIETGYREYRWLPEVTQIPHDAAVTEIVPGAVDAQVARGSVQAERTAAARPP